MSKGAQRFEIFTGAGKRRDWPPEVKASIVAECYAGEGVSAVARRHGLDPSQVYAWRRDLRKQFEAEGLIPATPRSEAPVFVPAVIDAVAAVDPAPTRRPRRRRRANTAAVELKIEGVAVKIGRDADASLIAAVIEALKATR